MERITVELWRVTKQCSRHLRPLLTEYVISKNRAKLLESQSQETIMTDLLELPSGATMEAAKEDDEILFLVNDYNEFK